MSKTKFQRTAIRTAIQVAMHKIDIFLFFRSTALLCFLCLLFLCLPWQQEPALADESPVLSIERGNAAYQESRFVEAKEHYRRALSAGIENGHLRYNLANAHLRLGEIGLAIANYRRALADLPRDPDVIANLKFARAKTQDKVSAESDIAGIFEHLIATLSPPLSDFEATTIFLGLYSLGWISFCFGVARDTSTFRSLGLGIVGTSLFFSLFVFGTAPGRLGAKRLAITAESKAVSPVVVLPKQLDVRAGDGESFQIIAVVHEGAELLSDEERGDWAALLLPDSRRGWVKRAELEWIFPNKQSPM